MMSANQEKLLRDTYTSLGKSVSLGGCSDDSLKMFYEFIKNNQKNTKIAKMIQDYEYLVDMGDLVCLVSPCELS